MCLWVGTESQSLGRYTTTIKAYIGHRRKYTDANISIHVLYLCIIILLARLNITWMLGSF